LVYSILKKLDPGSRKNFMGPAPLVEVCGLWDKGKGKGPYT